MNWDAIGAIGQMVSALALVIVIVQVRYARKEVQRSAVLTRLEGTRDLFLMQATDDVIGPSMLRAAEAAGVPMPPIFQYLSELGLNPTEAFRLNAYNMAIWNNFEASIESIGYLTPGVRREVDNAIRGNFNNPVVAKWFEGVKVRLNPDAVRYIENLMSQPG